MNLYDQLRHFADSYGLIAIFVLFLGLCLWVFRPGAKRQSDAAARLIFDEDDQPEGRDDGK